MTNAGTASTPTNPGPAHGVVVGYDGSDHARAAVDWAAAEAVLRGLPLRIVNAFTPPMGGAGLGYGTVLPANALEQIRTGVLAELGTLAEEVRSAHPGLEVSVNALIGNSAAAVLEEASKAQLVVVGSRGLGGFRGLLLGSTGVQVATHAPCPAAIIRGTAPDGARSVVVGIDGSELSLAALEYGFDLASRHGWDLVAAHAWDVPTYDLLAAPAGPPAPNLAEVEESEVRAAGESLAGFRDRYPDVAVSEVVVKGPVVRALMEAAEAPAAIVVGSRGRGEVVGAVLGSVSQGLLHRATVPVVVVRPDAG